MNRPIKLSCVIITHNEAEKIGHCLDSINDVADEIIICDSFSKDNTEKICKEHGVRFYQREFDGYINQKNYANSLAEFDYILSLDADECLSDELVKKIEEIKNSPDYDVYTFNRLTQFRGKWIRHCGWYPDRKKRLWRKGVAQWGGPTPHETLIVNDRVRQTRINADILHYSFDNYEDFLNRQYRYAMMMAEANVNTIKRSKYNVAFLIFNPLFTFFRDYFLKLGFLDGMNGFLICSEKAISNFHKYARVRDLVRNKK